MSKTTTTTEPPPEDSTCESYWEEIRTSGITGNTFDVGPNVNAGLNLSQYNVSARKSTYVPPVSDGFDEEIIMKEDSDSLEDFVAIEFSFQVDSDNDDDNPMSKGDYRKLNQKLDDILSQSSTLMTTKFEELLSLHQATI